MRKMSKMMALLLAVMMIASLFAVTAIAEDREMEGNLYLTGLPLVKEKESFSILADNWGVAADELSMPSWVEEQTNVAWDLITYTYETSKERKNILVMSGDYPDAMGGWLLSDNDILTLSQQDQILLPLEDLIAKYAPNIDAVLNIEGVRADMTQLDGHVYSVPYVVNEPLAIYTPFIGLTYLEQVGMEMPQTVEEFKAFLLAVKDAGLKNPNGDTVIPFSADPNNFSLGELAGWYGMNCGNQKRNAGHFSIVNGELIFNGDKEPYKQIIELFAELYAAGCIDPELYTQDNNTYDAKSKTDLYAVNYCYGSVGIEDHLFEDDPATPLRQYRPLPVLRAEGVDKPVWRRNAYGTVITLDNGRLKSTGKTLFTSQLVITDNCKNPGTVLRYFDFIYNPVNSRLVENGPLGVRYELKGDELWEIEDWKAKLTDEQKLLYDSGKNWVGPLPKNQDGIVVNLPASSPDAISYQENELRDQMYEPYLEDEMIPILKYSSEDSVRVADLQTAIFEYVKQQEARWVTGLGNVDDEWDAYLAQLDKLGLPELLTLKQNAYAAAKGL